MKISIITSCTGDKSVHRDDQITLDDFKQGEKYIQKREKELKQYMVAAEDLYSGMQHVRLMRGVRAARSAGIEVDLSILSAGYGLVEAERLLAPYEATFNTMTTAEAKKWSSFLKISESVQNVLGRPCDLTFVLLGDEYLKACSFDESTHFSSSTILFCGQASLKKLPQHGSLHPVKLANADATRFSCGLIGLKGELVARLLELIGQGRLSINSIVNSESLLSDLDRLTNETVVTKKRSAAIINPNVDRVIVLPEAWKQMPHRKKLGYFIPDWDDQVDPEFDFDTETHSGGTGEWGNQVYAHQMFDAPNYDGILISKIVAEQSKKKAERINRLGVHRHLRVPRDFPVMGDCGAFGYINEYEPPFNTNEILDYYTRLDFDYGVSIDHFAIGEEADRKRRYDLTIENARDFIVEHKKLDLNWTPIGAVQGWDEASFSKAAKQYAGMGYKYIAVGAMVRRRTPEILSIVEQVRKVIPPEMRLHLFGVARLNAIQDFARVGVNSADSASWLRKAWLGGAGNNYLSVDGLEFGAIRIPEAEKSFRAKRMVTDGRASLEVVKKHERACIQAMHAFDRDQLSVESLLDTLHEYDQLVTPERQDNRAYLRRTLEAKPWKTCPCNICRTVGIDVVIFRGNNRNRRRGFHNTYAFYELFQRALAGEIIPALNKERNASQMNLALGAETFG